MLSEMKINEFIELLASKEPAPGGGSAAALSGAIGTALISMVANLTIGKKKFIEYEPLMMEILNEAKTLRQNMLLLIEEDTKAFNGVSAVFDMPKITEQQKAKRKAAMQEALKNATLVPIEMMEKAVSALKLLKKSQGCTNPSAESDLGVAALTLKAALFSAWLNVKINLNSISDEDFIDKYGKKSKELLDKGNILAEHVYNGVLKNMNIK